VLLVVERVAVLRHVGMFSHAPGRLLAGLAQVLEEVDFPAGAVLMEAGAIEDWLFVLVEGEVDVTRQDRWIRMGPGTTVGEMELLDPQGRSATIAARTPVRALRLSKAAFDEALRLSPEIARGVIIDLIRRLRETHEPRPPS
jgi:CRP/FNR family transcriptional regulator, cyclic AMP receptor protein